MSDGIVGVELILAFGLREGLVRARNTTSHERRNCGSGANPCLWLEQGSGVGENKKLEAGTLTFGLLAAFERVKLTSS